MNKRCAGFTLIELLIAMSITSVLMLSLLSLLSQASAHYTHTNREINSLSQARAFFQFFERELSTKLPKSPLLIDNTPSAEGISFVRVISHEAEEESDLQLVRYHVAMTNDDLGNHFPALFRSVYSSSDTQAFLEQDSSAILPTNKPLTEEIIIPNILHFTAELGSGPTINLSISFVDESSALRYRKKSDWKRLAATPRDHERKLIHTYQRVLSLNP